MNIDDAMKKYRILKFTTPEDLERRYSKMLNYDNKVVIAGYYYNGPNEPGYFGAVYEFLDGKHACESPIALRAVSDVEFKDNGHAIAWALRVAASVND